MKIKDEILAILAECTTSETIIYLPQVQLDRKTYEVVNKCLESIGGKWNRKAKGHIVDGDAAELLDNLVLTGETTDLKKEYQFFPTPREIGVRMCEMAEINEHSQVLEPSAGNGKLIEAILAAGPRSIYAVELNPQMAEGLWKYNEDPDGPVVVVEQGDFLKLGLANKIRVNRIVMNPPFAKQQDIDHIFEAFKVLHPGGILVSVVSESPFFRTNRKSAEFREFLEKHDTEMVQLPEGAFKESGTMVRTRIIKIQKAG
ncbi:type I restriction-modification system methyltransferase subunit-like protein [Syntrophobotulus glycolicus DSM 8271]|uniref:Type I restriction-modification system methyltransferase subunit-like protein n=1 Tax=Syntrophobotulus glycolicus (strain DSM 8271 / FlGlyR) TaxID=645991 RepID=F0SXD5_SYNGF|nr:class I SAM-dependent methyltransferase [Syntrophobotulus glycolicus]ADY54681.1 type I restriction-modification system methyltransferase subunit-like protein [Syntrophobotulus glycolicus DSM 8271]